jgi:hypothetical protein
MARQASALLVRLGAVLFGLALVGRLASASAANRAMGDLALVASAAVVVVGLVGLRLTGARLTGGRKPPAPGSGSDLEGQEQHRQPADRRARRRGLPSAAPLVNLTGEQATTRTGAQE